MNKHITIVGLGAGDINQLPLGIYKSLVAYKKVYIRTMDHPVVEHLQGEGIELISFDDTYEAHDNFESVYRDICSSLLHAAEKERIVYAVPGHPLVAEATVKRLVEEENEGNVTLQLLGGQSFLDPMFSALRIDPIDGFQLLDGTDFRRETLQIRQHIIIAQVYDSFVASEVKLTLMEKLPDDYEIKVVTAAGSEKEVVLTIPLYELDRVTTLSNLTAVYVPPVSKRELLYRDFDMLRQVFAELRGPNGCPWDKEQTHESLKKYLIEEAYEVLDAIDKGNEDDLVEELGDVLLQVVLHSQIGEDNGIFSIDQVIETLTEKMIRRHPHVFGQAEVHDADNVVTQWEEIKRLEKEKKGLKEEEQSILSNVPSSLPSLLRAFNIQKKVSKVGFDWGDEAPMWMKLQEEIAEWFQELKEGTKQDASKELGDVLFAFVNIARFHGIDPEEALRQTNDKFTQRFQYIEQKLKSQGKNIKEQSLEALDAIWNEAKTREYKGE
ncbi:nucleoside triphosphate pyrophosphohydrolase [Evansella cellulosilytica]|uniref:MazG family protein n=1 Tax=Evansella cellulosilytica (strain ATCC 21833 / DSM 2522 / FERM P-1141 / JCM 9156 / N-4) TaxID=649639 RepID=E6TRQ5_EVAC2|nr:nucleoside triphosphate pyrophosphohydrolase [Evansella cellulosilytica]ADU28349.1 MazG family protein [Evansella cellulosilytica DSM 2522]